MCATSLGKICASDHAMNAVGEMSSLNRDLKLLFDKTDAKYPVWEELENDAKRYLKWNIQVCLLGCGCYLSGTMVFDNHSRTDYWEDD